MVRHWLSELEQLRQQLALPSWDPETDLREYIPAMTSGTELDRSVALSAVVQSAPGIAQDLLQDLARRKVIELRAYEDDQAISTFAYLGYGANFECDLDKYAWLAPRETTDDWVTYDWRCDWEDVENDFANNLDVYLENLGFENEISTLTLAACAYAGAHRGDLIVDDRLRNNALLPSFQTDGDWGGYKTRLTDQFDWRGLRWPSLTDSQQVNVVSRFLAVRDYEFFAEFRYVNHIVTLILLHPTTCEGVFGAVEAAGGVLRELAARIRNEGR